MTINKGMTFKEHSVVHLAVKEEYAEFAKGPEFWKLDQSEREKYLNKVSALPLISLRSKDPLEPIGQLSVSFFPSEVSALKLKAKVARILDGNIHLGFSGPRSCIVSSDSGTQPHVVSAVSNHNM